MSGEAAALGTIQLRGAIEWALLVVAFSLAPLVLGELPFGGRLYRLLAGAWVLGAALLPLVNSTGFVGNEAPLYIAGLAAYLLFAMLLFVRLLRSLLGHSDGAA